MQINIKDKILSREEVLKLLIDTKAILESKDFDFNNIYISSRKKNNDFMLNENIDKNDVVDILKKLDVSNYIKSVLDVVDIEPLYLHEFAVEYNNIKYIYLKYKIREKILQIKIISLHKNEFDINFIYR